MVEPSVSVPSGAGSSPSSAPWAGAMPLTSVLVVSGAAVSVKLSSVSPHATHKRHLFPIPRHGEGFSAKKKKKEKGERRFVPAGALASLVTSAILESLAVFFRVHRSQYISTIEVVPLMYRYKASQLQLQLEPMLQETRRCADPKKNGPEVRRGIGKRRTTPPA